MFALRRDSSKARFCVVGIFYFVNSRKGPFTGWNVSGRDYRFFAQNSGKTPFSTSALTGSCKRELGIISNPPPRLLIQAYSRRFSRKRNLSKTAVLCREGRLLLRFLGWYRVR